MNYTIKCTLCGEVIQGVKHRNGTVQFGEDGQHPECRVELLFTAAPVRLPHLHDYGWQSKVGEATRDHAPRVIQSQILSDEAVRNDAVDTELDQVA